MTNRQKLTLVRVAIAVHLLVLALVLAAAFSGCATSGTVTLPKLPAWEAPSDARTITSAEVVRQVQQLAPLALVSMSDGTFTLVSDAWFDRYLSWTWAAAKADGLDYTAESFDCEDFADAFALFVRRAAGRAGVKAAPLVARLKVAQNITFANVPGVPGTMHKVIGVATDRGVYIVEPQPAAGAFRKTPLAKYPNPILDVKIGD